MAEACNITARSGGCKGLEQAQKATVKGELQGKHMGGLRQTNVKA